MSKKFLTQHLNQVSAHRRSGTEKKLAEQKAILTANPPNFRQSENTALKEQQDRIAQEQLVLKAKQAVVIRENEVYRLQQESATKERIVCEQLKKEKEQVVQQVIALRIEQEIVDKANITLKLEQEQATRDHKAFRESQQNTAKMQEALELERDQLASEERETFAQEREALRIEREAVAKERISLREEQERAVENEEALRERQQNITKMQEALELERERIVKEQQEREQLAKVRAEQEKTKAEINIPVQELLVAEKGVDADDDYYIVPLAGEDNN